MNAERGVIGTTDKSKASIFYVEKQVCPREFSIAYYGEEYSNTSMRGQSVLSKHLTTKSRVKGRDEGPLRIGGGRAANFTLRHPRKTDLGIDNWESDACFIKLAPRKMQRKSYVAFDVGKNKTMCVSCREEGEKFSMRFNLTRVKIESSQARYRVFSDSSDEQVSAKPSGGEKDEEEKLPSIEEGIVFEFTKGELKPGEDYSIGDGCGIGENDGTGGGLCSGGVQSVGGCHIECDSEETLESTDEDDNFSDIDFFEFAYDQISDSD